MIYEEPGYRIIYPGPECGVEHREGTVLQVLHLTFRNMLPLTPPRSQSPSPSPSLLASPLYQDPGRPGKTGVMSLKKE